MIVKFEISNRDNELGRTSFAPKAQLVNNRARHLHHVVSRGLSSEESAGCRSAHYFLRSYPLYYPTVSSLWELGAERKMQRLFFEVSGDDKFNALTHCPPVVGASVLSP